MFFVCQKTSLWPPMAVRSLFSSTTFPSSITKTYNRLLYVCGLLSPIKKKMMLERYMVFSDSSWNFPKRKIYGLCVRLTETAP